MDRSPLQVCDNIRIERCRIYSKEATDDAFRGHIASKRRYFYGLKVFLLTTSKGHPVEVFFTPGSFSDTAQLKHFAFDLAEGATGYREKAFNEYSTEDLLAEASKIELVLLRKKDSKRAVPAYAEHVQHYYRKAVETAASLIERRLPKTIHVVTAAGFELKVFLFVLAFSGLVYGLLAKAAITGTVGGGALTMAVFGLSTIPALYLLALSGFLMQPVWRRRPSLSEQPPRLKGYHRPVCWSCCNAAKADSGARIRTFATA